MASEWLAPTLGLVGTVSVTVVGLYQWKKSEKQRRSARYRIRRAEVMESLVQQLQHVQLLSRSGIVSADEMNAQTRGLDHFLIENRLWLEETDCILAREYLRTLSKIQEAIQNDPAQFELQIGTSPIDIYDEGVAHLFVQLGHAEKRLVARTRRAMRI